MNYKKEIETLLSTLKKRGYDRRTIEERLSYREFYIDQLLSKGGNARFLKILKSFDEANVENNNKPSSRGQKFQISIDAGKAIGHLIESDINLAARITVIEQMLEQSVSQQTGQSIAVVSGERKKAVNMEADRLFVEQKQKAGF